MFLCGIPLGPPIPCGSGASDSPGVHWKSSSDSSMCVYIIKKYSFSLQKKAKSPSWLIPLRVLAKPMKQICQQALRPPVLSQS